MAVLSNTDLRHALAVGSISVEPPEWLAMQRESRAPHLDPAGIGLHLGTTWQRQRVLVAQELHPSGEVIDTRRPSANEWEPLQDMGPLGSIVVHPGELILAQTAEVIRLDDRHAAKVYARSTTGRWGVEVCGCAGWVDPGFVGTLTLELRVVGGNAVRLYAGQRIAQLVVLRTISPADPAYEGQYSGQVVATVPGRL